MNITELVRGLFKTASVALFTGAIIGIVAVGLFLFLVTKDLPEVSSLKEFRHPMATIVYSDEGTKIGEFTNERRYAVNFDAIPKHVILAFIAAEDSHFYEHGGIDFAGIFRAVFSNVLRGRYAQGGSTITQQVARALLLATRKKEITRKIREMVLARRMERELSKNEILNLYLNEIYLGHGAFGIGAAAQNYFHKTVDQLTLAEGSMLAGLPQRPNEWTPFRNPYLAKRRQSYVLKRMVDEGFISQDQARTALAEPMRLFVLEDLNNEAAPYFVEYVRQYLMNKYGSDQVLTKGYKIHTTVKYTLQKTAENSMLKGLRDVDKRLGWRGVTQHADTPQKMEEIAKQIHDEVLEKLTKARILTANADSANRSLEFELTPFLQPNSGYFGPTPLKVGELYRGIVTSVNPEIGEAHAKVGQTPVVLSWGEMSWVQGGEKPVKSLKEALKVGDVVHLSVQSIDAKSGLVAGSLEQDPEIQGALLSYDVETGFVRAMVGGKSFLQSKFNCALQAKRQVGSTFKPVVYAAALDKGYSPSSMVTDAPLVFKFEGGLDADNTGEDWRPHNYGGTFEGDIPLRLALIRSMNIPTVKLLDAITVDYGIQYARNLGITSVLPRDLSIGLGSWSSSLEEMMRAYAVFPRLGRPVNLVYIKKVEDENGNILEQNNGEDKAPAAVVVTGNPQNLPPGTVISPQTAYVVTDMLKGVIREGTGRGAASLGLPLAGKTGTSNDHRDAWFIGYTPHVMTGVWLGYEKDKPLAPGETGGKAAAPIFVEYMRAASEHFAKNDFPIPDDIVFAYVDRRTGRLANNRTPTRVRVAFKVGTVPNSTGDNLPRIGEPGSRSMTASPTPEEIPLPTGDTSKQGETSDYLRQGYQD